MHKVGSKPLQTYKFICLYKIIWVSGITPFLYRFTLTCTRLLFQTIHSTAQHQCNKANRSGQTAIIMQSYSEKKWAEYLLWVLIIKWCIAWCYTLQFIIKVNNNFSQRQAVLHEYPLTAGEKFKGSLLQPGISWWPDANNVSKFI